MLSAFSVRNIVKFSDPVVPRAPSERHDWEIIAGLAGRVLALRPLRSAPHGIDIGPLDAAPEEFLREARRRWFSEAEHPNTGELLLIGRRQLRSNNSWMHNAPRLTKGLDRCTLLIQPFDAESRGLTTGDVAQLGSEGGHGHCSGGAHQ